jgi:glycosyltransferase involved in cell wall biosynthesis
MNQTYPRIEHLIVQDGGHSSEAVVEPYRGRKPGLEMRFIGTPQKVGRSRAGNLAMEAAHGEYLLFLDDDDLLIADHIETLYGELVDSDVDAAYSLTWEIRTDIRDMPSADYDEHRLVFAEWGKREFDRSKLAEVNYIPIQAILFKKQLYRDLGGFDEDLDSLEDWVLWKKYSLNHEFKLVHKLTSMFRTPHDAQIRDNREKILLDAYEEASRRHRYS